MDITSFFVWLYIAFIAFVILALCFEHRQIRKWEKMIAEKQAVTGTPAKMVGNKAVFQHGEVTDVYNTDMYRLVPDYESSDKDTMTWVTRACDGDQTNLHRMTGTVEAAVWGYDQLYGQT